MQSGARLAEFANYPTQPHAPRTRVLGRRPPRAGFWGPSSLCQVSKVADQVFRPMANGAARL
eukprot:4314825-Alexandrium_andersonii.AAC.1